ncbi:MAG: hypothetical protein WC636_05755 [Candidatus Margulisiibacteriota bacterium]
MASYPFVRMEDGLFALARQTDWEGWACTTVEEKPCVAFSRRARERFPGREGLEVMAGCPYLELSSQAEALREIREKIALSGSTRLFPLNELLWEELTPEVRSIIPDSDMIFLPIQMLSDRGLPQVLGGVGESDYLRLFLEEGFRPGCLLFAGCRRSPRVDLNILNRYEPGLRARLQQISDPQFILDLITHDHETFLALLEMLHPGLQDLTEVSPVFVNPFGPRDPSEA